MSGRVRRNELHSAVRTFLGYLEDLEQCTLDQSRTKLRLVMNYSQKDIVTKALTQQLLLRMPAERLVQQVTTEFMLPQGPLERMAFSYSLLYQLKLAWKLELREILSRNEFEGSGLEGRWLDFRGKVVRSLIDGVEFVQSWIESDGSADQHLDPTEVFRYALLAYEGSAEPVCTPPPEAAREDGPDEDLIATLPTAKYVRPSFPADGDALAALEAAIDAGGHSENLTVDAQILSVELQKTEPNPDRLGELLAGFAHADAKLLSPCMALLLEACPPLQSPRREAEAKPAKKSKAKKSKAKAKPAKAKAKKSKAKAKKSKAKATKSKAKKKR